MPDSVFQFPTGKKPAAPYNPQVGFGTHFAAEAVPLLIPPPYIADWRMLANNVAADCVEAGAAHEVMAWAVRAKKQLPLFTPTAVLADYRAVNPNDKEYTLGTSVLEYANYRLHTGILDSSGMRHKIDAWAQLKPGNTDQLAQAVSRFGVVGLGVALPQNASLQFNWAEPWSLTNPPLKGEHGHYICVVGRNSLGNWLVVTWGRLHAATEKWVQEYMDEGYVYVQEEMLRPGEDIDALKAALQEIAP